ncbi:hypothetical protein HHK36_032271 [Tetracentron sinense]|uniref:DUF7876 domain-containing protein n=1 Tax=Tetracentron sinense TaxID=13715 RepID=A0A835CXT6_TETSI|nr:hypothetical protein HHK36_032271 [Tetracentron sinense]
MQVDECILWLSIIFITILCTPQPTIVRWSSMPPVSAEIMLQWKGFCALIANAYCIKGMAWTYLHVLLYLGFSFHLVSGINTALHGVLVYVTRRFNSYPFPMLNYLRLPVKTLQQEQTAVVGRAEEPSVVASRMQLVFSTLEVC